MVTRRLYRNGSSGDHSRALGTGMRKLDPTVPLAVPTTVLPLSTCAVTEAPAWVPWTTRSSPPAATFGVVSSRVIRCAVVGSSHTVCQMPDAGVYMMPPRLSRCLPTGMSWPSVGSQTPTMTSLDPARRAEVMLYENLS